MQIRTEGLSFEEASARIAASIEEQVAASCRQGSVILMRPPVLVPGCVLLLGDVFVFNDTSSSNDSSSNGGGDWAAGGKQNQQQQEDMVPAVTSTDDGAGGEERIWTLAIHEESRRSCNSSSSSSSSTLAMTFASPEDFFLALEDGSWQQSLATAAERVVWVPEPHNIIVSTWGEELKLLLLLPKEGPAPGVERVTTHSIMDSCSTDGGSEGIDSSTTSSIDSSSSSGRFGVGRLGPLRMVLGHAGRPLLDEELEAVPLLSGGGSSSDAPCLSLQLPNHPVGNSSGDNSSSSSGGGGSSSSSSGGGGGSTSTSTSRSSSSSSGNEASLMSLHLLPAPQPARAEGTAAGAPAEAKAAEAQDCSICDKGASTLALLSLTSSKQQQQQHPCAQASLLILPAAAALDLVTWIDGLALSQAQIRPLLCDLSLVVHAAESAEWAGGVGPQDEALNEGALAAAVRLVPYLQANGLPGVAELVLERVQVLRHPALAQMPWVTSMGGVPTGSSLGGEDHQGGRRGLNINGDAGDTGSGATATAEEGVGPVAGSAVFEDGLVATAATGTTISGAGATISGAGALASCGYGMPAAPAGAASGAEAAVEAAQQAALAAGAEAGPTDPLPPGVGRVRSVDVTALSGRGWKAAVRVCQRGFQGRWSSST